MPEEPKPTSLPPVRAGRPPRKAAIVGVMLLVCAAGLGLRLWLGWWLGYLGDIQCWQLWGLDPGEYVPSSDDPSYLPLPKNYPPMYMCVVRIQRWVHRGLGLPGDYTRPLELRFHDNPNAWRPLILYLKLPCMVADVATAWFLLGIGRQLGQAWRGVAAAAFYLFSPAILYDGAYYGQTDTILVMFLVGAAWAWLGRKPVWWGAMMMGAPLMKVQALFALPVLGLAVLGRWGIWRPMFARVAAGAVGMLAAVVALSWWTGMLGQFYHGYFRLSLFYPLVTVRAFNFWWLLLRPWDKVPRMFDFPRDDVKLLGLVSLRWIGIILFFSVLGLILWRLHRARYSPRAMALALAAAGWAFFNLPTQMHERYSVPAVGLMTLLIFWERRWFWITLLVSCTAALNIAEVCYLFVPYRRMRDAVNYFIVGEMHPAWTLFAVIHVLMIPFLIERLWREGGVTRPFPVAEAPAPAAQSPTRT